MKSTRTEILEDMIPKLRGIKEIMEKELHYDWSVTDEIEAIIEALEFDLGETQEHDDD